MPSHSLGWFRWVCETWEILPGFEWYAERAMDDKERVKGAVYEGDLVNYAAFQGSVEILKFLLEEVRLEMNGQTDVLVGAGGSVEVLEYLKGEGHVLTERACHAAAHEGQLETLKWFRQQVLQRRPDVYHRDGLYGRPTWPLRWSRILVEEYLDIAEENNHEDTASWLRSELTHLSNIPELPESDSDWSGSLS